MLKVVAALKLSFICKTIFDITKLSMFCFSGCELHLIKDIIMTSQISVICNNKKTQFVNKRLLRKLFSVCCEISSDFNTDG